MALPLLATMLKFANAFSAVIASATKPVIALKAKTAFIAAKLSEQTAIQQLFLSNKQGKDFSLKDGGVMTEGENKFIPIGLDLHSAPVRPVRSILEPSV